MINAHLFTARDIMATKLVTLSPETSIFDAITMLLKNKFSGAPVVEKDGTLCGVLSEKDCMRVLAGGSYDHRDGEELISVAAFMSRHLITIKLDDGIYHIVDTFDKHNVRRLPVVENGRLVGQVSRRDVLRAHAVLRSAASGGPPGAQELLQRHGARGVGAGGEAEAVGGSVQAPLSRRLTRQSQPLLNAVARRSRRLKRARGVRPSLEQFESSLFEVWIEGERAANRGSPHHFEARAVHEAEVLLLTDPHDLDRWKHVEGEGPERSDAQSMPHQRRGFHHDVVGSQQSLLLFQLGPPDRRRFVVVPVIPIDQGVERRSIDEYAHSR
jgi:CBS domain-containing protein